MRKHPIWFLIIGIFILIIPTVVALCIVIPQMQERYVILMSSGGIITGSGMFGASKIPDKVKYSGLYKLSANAFSLMTGILLVKEFIIEILMIATIFIASFIIYKVLKEAWKDGKRKLEIDELAGKISQGVNQSSK